MMLGEPCYVIFEDLQYNAVSLLTEIMKTIPTYEIDIWLTVYIIQNKTQSVKAVDSIVGDIVYHLAKAINTGKLRKHIEIEG
nr:MAG TPA: hypothetical protein [Caudoviricetes sp.]